MASKPNPDSSAARAALALPIVAAVLLFGSTRTRVGRSALERFGDWLNARMLAIGREIIALEEELDQRASRDR